MTEGRRSVRTSQRRTRGRASAGACYDFPVRASLYEGLLCLKLEGTEKEDIRRVRTECASSSPNIAACILVEALAAVVIEPSGDSDPD